MESKLKYILLILLLSFLPEPFHKIKAQEDESSSKAKELDLPKYDFLDNKTSIRDPLKLRDPFKSTPGVEKEKSKSQFKVDKNFYTNLKVNKNIKLSDLQIIGVIIGPNRRAMARLKGSKQNVFIIKEGMKLGENQAEVKAILPAGIVIVEKITNIYNQDEYIETIIPVQSQE